MNERQERKRKERKKGKERKKERRKEKGRKKKEWGEGERLERILWRTMHLS